MKTINIRDKTVSKFTVQSVTLVKLGAKLGSSAAHIKALSVAYTGFYSSSFSACLSPCLNKGSRTDLFIIAEIITMLEM